MAEPLAKRPKKYIFSIAEKLWYLGDKADHSLSINQMVCDSIHFIHWAEQSLVTQGGSSRLDRKYGSNSCN